MRTPATTHQPIYFMSSEDPEFDRAFNTFPDPEMWNDLYGEALQYMGTVEKTVGHYVHEFRHRAVPDTNQRQYWRVLATHGWQPREIVMAQHLTRLGA